MDAKVALKEGQLIKLNDKLEILLGGMFVIFKYLGAYLFMIFSANILCRTCYLWPRSSEIDEAWFRK